MILYIICLYSLIIIVPNLLFSVVLYFLNKILYVAFFIFLIECICNYVLNVKIDLTMIINDTKNFFLEFITNFVIYDQVVNYYRYFEKLFGIHNRV